MEIRHLALSFQRPFSFDRRRYRHRLDDDFPPFFFFLSRFVSRLRDAKTTIEFANLRFALVLRIARRFVTSRRDVEYRL